MGILDNFLKELGTGDQIHDYQHASKIFVSDGFKLAPKHQYLFYTRFTLNPAFYEMQGIFNKEQLQTMGSLVKKFDLPKFTIETKTNNAYNRPNVTQHKIKYSDVNITFHDDADDTVRRFWFSLMNHYFRDADYQDATYSGMKDGIYDFRGTQGWGYNPSPSLNGLAVGGTPSATWAAEQLLLKVEMFSFHNNKYSQYTLQNPTITGWRHGEHDYSQGSGVMEHTMQLAYEAVTYSSGYVTQDSFSDMLLLYDRNPSPLSVAGGGTQSILGPGGLLDAASSIGTDLSNGNYGAAIFKALRSGKNFKGANLAALAKGEALGVVNDMLRGNNPLSKFNVPSLGSIGASLGLTGSKLSSASGIPGGIGGVVGVGAALLAASGQAGGAVASLGKIVSSPVGLALTAAAAAKLSGLASTTKPSPAVTTNGEPVAVVALSDTYKPTPWPNNVSDTAAYSSAVTTNTEEA